MFARGFGIALVLALLFGPSPAGSRQTRRLQRVKRAVARLVPKRIRARSALHHEVATLLKQDRRLARYPLRLRRRSARAKGLDGVHGSIGLESARRLTHRAHQAEGVAFLAGKAIPEPALQAGYFGLEALAFVGLHRLETHIMETALVAAVRKPGPDAPRLSNRAMRWLHGRLRRRHTRLARADQDLPRYKTWLLLKQVEQELGRRGQQIDP